MNIWIMLFLSFSEIVDIKKPFVSWLWGKMPVISAFRKLRQEYWEFR
jgi:hypothetical protein